MGAGVLAVRDGPHVVGYQIKENTHVKSGHLSGTYISTRQASFLQAFLRNVRLEGPSFRQAYIESRILWPGAHMMLASELFSRAPVESVGPGRVVM